MDTEQLVIKQLTRLRKVYDGPLDIDVSYISEDGKTLQRMFNIYVWSEKYGEIIHSHLAYSYKELINGVSDIIKELNENT